MANSPDIDGLLRSHAERLKKIFAKRKKGQKLSDDELEVIGWNDAETGSTRTSYDSIGSAAAALGIDPSVLRRDKRAGADGFRGSRVYALEYLKWLQKQKPTAETEETKETLERKYLRVRIERQQFFFDCDRGEYCKSTDIAQWVTSMISEFVKVLDAVPSTIAPDLAGVTSVAEIELRLRAVIDRVKETLHSGPWTSEPSRNGSTRSG